MSYSSGFLRVSEKAAQNRGTPKRYRESEHGIAYCARIGHDKAGMPFAIMQKELLAPSVEHLARAFRSMPNLTALDAQTAANDAFGILWRGLDLEGASALQDALMKQSVEVEVVEESELPVLPPSKVIKQIEFLPTQLAMYDPMGRSFTMPWSDLMLIAAGNVRRPDYNKRKAHSPAEAARNNEASGGDEELHLMLELVLAGGVARYSMIADEFVFNHLGARLTKEIDRNFELVVRELSEYAPHAGLNRGAFLICQNEKEIFTYPGKPAFNEEIVWFLWRIGREK